MSKGYLSNTDQGDFSHCPSPVPPSVSHCPPVNLRVHPKELDGNRNSPLNRVNPDQGGKLRRTRVAVSAFFQLVTASGFVSISVPSPKLTITYVSALVAVNEESNAVAPAAVGKPAGTAIVLG